MAHQPSNRCFCLQMSPAPEGWEEAAADSEGFVQVHQGTERSYLAKRLVPGVQYCGRVRAINCEVRACLMAGSHRSWRWQQLPQSLPAGAPTSKPAVASP
jgi:hypothetical protein